MIFTLGLGSVFMFSCARGGPSPATTQGAAVGAAVVYQSNKGFKELRLRQWNMMNKPGAIEYVSVYGRKEILLRMK
jgi:hypothetical protein